MFVKEIIEVFLKLGDSFHCLICCCADYFVDRIANLSSSFYNNWDNQKKFYLGFFQITAQRFNYFICLR